MNSETFNHFDGREFKSVTTFEFFCPCCGAKVKMIQPEQLKSHKDEADHWLKEYELSRRKIFQLEQLLNAMNMRP